jgi:hypothetical protein
MPILLPTLHRGKNTPMDIFTINLKPYRIRYRLAVIVTGLLIAGCWATVFGGHFVLLAFYRNRQVYLILLAAFILAPLYFGSQSRKKLKSLDGIEDFEEKQQLHEAMYKGRVWWLALMAAGSCVLYLTSGRVYFLYLSLFEYLMLLVSFPNERLIRKELKNEDIIFI